MSIEHGDLATVIRSAVRPNQRCVIYTCGCLAARRYTKTADGLLRYAPDRIRGIADELAKVDRLAELPAWRWAPDVPVGPDPLDLLRSGDDLVVGIAIPGSVPLRADHRARIVGVAEAGHRVLNGLHDRIDHPNVVNLRRFTADQRILAAGAATASARIVTVGTGPDVGKMTTTVELQQSLVASGVAADWLPTGQTGMLIRGYGYCVDAAPSDFASGLVEHSASGLEGHAEAIVVEGQGSILEPMYSPVTVAIVHGARARYHVLCHRARPDEDDPARLIELAADRYDRLHGALGLRSTLIGVSVNPAALPPDKRRRAVENAGRLGVPSVDVIEDGAGPIAESFLALRGRRREE